MLKILKKGGVLVYSTCSIIKKENEDNIKKFLNENKDFSLIDIKYDELQKNGNNIKEQGIIKIYPDENMDGFFISKLLKK